MIEKSGIAGDAHNSGTPFVGLLRFRCPVERVLKQLDAPRLFHIVESRNADHGIGGELTGSASRQIDYRINLRGRGNG